MQALRNSITLTRLVMAWFVLTLGIAVASPIVNPQAMEMVCSAGGSMKMIVIDDNGPQDMADAHSALDCPLCLGIAAPPPLAAQHVTTPQPLGLALQPIVSARIAAFGGASLPPRGPPTHA